MFYTRRMMVCSGAGELPQTTQTLGACLIMVCKRQLFLPDAMFWVQWTTNRSVTLRPLYLLHLCSQFMRQHVFKNIIFYRKKLDTQNPLLPPSLFFVRNWMKAPLLYKGAGRKDCGKIRKVCQELWALGQVSGCSCPPTSTTAAFVLLAPATHG